MKGHYLKVSTYSMKGRHTLKNCAQSTEQSQRRIAQNQELHRNLLHQVNDLPVEMPEGASKQRAQRNQTRPQDETGSPCDSDSDEEKDDEDYYQLRVRDTRENNQRLTINQPTEEPPRQHHTQPERERPRQWTETLGAQSRENKKPTCDALRRQSFEQPQRERPRKQKEICREQPTENETLTCNLPDENELTSES